MSWQDKLEKDIKELEAQNKEYRNALTKIIQIDWSHTKESDHVKLNNCITWAEDAIKDGE
jgi:hypothetical protein